jgi:hypothetical protein
MKRNNESLEFDNMAVHEKRTVNNNPLLYPYGKEGIIMTTSIAGTALCSISGKVNYQVPKTVQMITQLCNGNVQPCGKLINVGKVRLPRHGSFIGRNDEIKGPILAKVGVLYKRKQDKKGIIAPP